MKKVVYVFALVCIITFTFSSCREVKEEKEESRFERAADEVEDAGEKAVEEVKGAADDVKEELDGETDDN